MYEKLREVETRYDELAEKLADPQVWSDQKEFQRLAKAHSDLTDVVTLYREYRKVREELQGTEEMLRDNLDDEMREMAESELDSLRETEQELGQKLKVMLLPKDPNDDKSVIIEIRAGTGGEEAALFAGDLYRMYTRYAERKGWKSELMSANETGIGGFKEAILAIDGRGAYSKLKFESGVHRVQRVPETESSGRIHTSAATVAVLPEAEEVEVEINPDDLQIDTCRSSSAGGQNVQKNETAIRIVHKPTGIVVTCQDERSQFQNKEKAMRVLRAHLLEMEIQKQHDDIAQTRRSMVGSGDRSEKIRTYNFPQSRITDHRIGVSLHRMDSFMDGDIQELIDHLSATDQAERLKTDSETE